MKNKQNVAAGNVDATTKKFSTYQFSILIELFIKKGVTFNWNENDYSRERGAVIRLLKQYPDFDFFYTLINLQNRFNSLLGLMGKYWKPTLEKRYKDFLEKKAKNPEYKIGEKIIDIKAEKTIPVTQIDFLKS